MGLVGLTPDPSNRSAKLVVLTPRGRRHVRDALRAFARLEAELGRRIGTARASALRRALEAKWGPPLAARSGLSGPR